LHTHSHYSLLDGASKIDDLIAKAKEYKMPALAITDHGNLFGAIEFYKKAFGATELFRMTAPDGKLGHAEIKIGDSPIQRTSPPHAME